MAGWGHTPLGAMTCRSRADLDRDPAITGRLTWRRGLGGDLRGELEVRQSPDREVGSFWPRTRVARPSIAETPVMIGSPVPYVLSSEGL